MALQFQIVFCFLLFYGVQSFIEIGKKRKK